MRILAIADAEDNLLASRLVRKSMGKFDAVVSCGDLRPGYLDLIATSANAPLLYVRGNHDVDEEAFERMGGTPLDGAIVKVAGVRIAGLDGSLNYREGIVGRSEGEQGLAAMGLYMRSWIGGGVDVLVTHAPALGFGDLEDLPHRGFSCFNMLLGRLKPKAMLFGHVHLDYGRMEREYAHPSGARLVNAFKHTVIEL